MSVPTSQIITENTSTLSFTQGLLLGQLSIALLLGAFIKFFIFGDPPSPDVTASLRATERRSITLAHKRSLLSLRSAPAGSATAARPRSSSYGHAPSGGGAGRARTSVLRPPAPLTIPRILSKTYYNVDAHQPESLDWFNVLVAQTIAQFREDARHDDEAILTSLGRALNGPSRPDFVDEIRVTELALGDDFPIFSNCRIIPLDEDGLALEHGLRGAGEHGRRLQARMDVDLSDVITLALETKLLLNYPKPLCAVLPVALAVSVERFSGTLSISFIPGTTSGGGGDGSGASGEDADVPDDTSGRPTTLAFSFLDDYRLDLSVRSLVGSRSRLQDVPKIAQLVESRLHAWFDERCVEPRFQQIELPSLWPRKRNTRGMGDDVGTAAGGSDDSAGAATATGTGSMGPSAGREMQRDLREEARREVEEEEEARRRAQQEDGLRWRAWSSGGVADGGAGGGAGAGASYAMPGSMPVG